MANGTQDYSLGELKARTDSQERRLNAMEKKMDDITEYIQEQKGGMKLIKGIGFVLGLLVTINTVVAIIF